MPNMDNVICNFCNKEFRKKKSQIFLSQKHYCSKICLEKSKKKGKLVECFVCKKLVYKKIKNLNLSKSGKYFCSHTCSNICTGERQRAENHSNWINGESSYKNLLKRTNSLKECVLCKKNDIRILCVHHLDKNRKNNKINNLIWLCHNCHFLVHNYKKEIK
jgi:hypothetical protein